MGVFPKMENARDDFRAALLLGASIRDRSTVPTR
jgi:hypothetical protein